jgi:precorrin-6B methylase 2
MRDAVMRAQHRLKLRLKPILLPDRTKPRRVRRGPGKGTVALLNPQRDLQRQWGLYESELNPIYRHYIGPTDVVYDIGAGDGLTTLVYAKLARRGTVLAFEPDPAAVSLLRANVTLNPDLDSAITIVPLAFGGPLHPQWPEPTFVKVDVDGAEVGVLGALEPLLGRRPTLVIETHSAGHEAECVTRLTSLGYATRVIPNASWRLLWPEWRPIVHNRWLLATPHSGEATQAVEAP